jgi:hypothetical protein
MSESSQGLLKVTRILGGIVLLAIAGIHLFLVFDGVGGVLGVLFILNSIAAIVLAIGMFALRGALVKFVVVLSLLFIIASLVSLLLALTVGLFGIHETWTFTLVPETIIVEAIGILVLVVASAAALGRRARRAV